MNSLLDKDLILIRKDVSNYQEVLELLGNIMIDKGYANPNYIEGLMEREREFATGVPAEPIGVAIPHTDSTFVKEDKIGLLTLNNPVKFGEMGSASNETVEVKLVILLGLADGERHIRALQKIIQLIQNSEFVEKIISANTNEEAYQLLEGNIEDILQKDV